MENGVLRPLTPLEIPDGEQVRLEIDTPDSGSVDHILSLAAQVYEGLSERDIDEIEDMARRRPDFFAKPDA